MASRKVLAPRTAVYHDGRGSDPMIEVGSVFPAEALNIFLGPLDQRAMGKRGHASTVIITTALAQRNNAGDAIGKYRGGCSLAQRKPSDQRSLHRSLGARRERNLSRHQKIFLQKRSSHHGYPLMRAEPFLGKFLGEG